MFSFASLHHFDGTAPRQHRAPQAVRAFQRARQARGDPSRERMTQSTPGMFNVPTHQRLDHACRNFSCTKVALFPHLPSFGLAHVLTQSFSRGFQPGSS